jgi:hypothetical protein
MSSTQAFIWRRFLVNDGPAPVADFNGVWCRKYSSRLQPARLGLRRFLRYLLLGVQVRWEGGLDGRWMTERSRKKIAQCKGSWDGAKSGSVPSPQASRAPQGIHPAGRSEV